MKSVSYKSEVEAGVDSVVSIVSIDRETGSTILNIVKTITTGRGLGKVTSIVANRTWRRAVRGSQDPVWFMQASDGTFHPVLDRSLVDEEARLTWIRHVTPIKKTNTLKEKKTYLDTTDYSRWREKMKQATSQLMN